MVIPPRFATADTTILRDTLDIKFDRIFVIADSLRATPDSLRALAVRYAFNLDRLMFLADSMRVRLDDLGAKIEEARGRILTAGAQQGVNFVYSSNYAVRQTSSTWTNQLDWQSVQGSRVLKNRTMVTLSRYTTGPTTTERQQRSSSTEAGWVLSPGLSVGGRIILQGFRNLDRSIYGVTDDNSDTQLSIESRHTPVPHMNSELNLYAGRSDQNKGSSGKQGYSGEMNGRVIYEPQAWLSNELTGRVTGSHSRVLTLGQSFTTPDFSSDFRGSLSMFQASPASLRVDYLVRNTHVEQVPQGTLLYVLPIVTRSRSVDATLRVQRDSDRYVDVTAHLGDDLSTLISGAGSVTTPDQINNGNDNSVTVTGTTLLAGWAFNTRFATSLSRDVTETVNPTQPYQRRRTDLRSRALDASLSRTLSPRLTTRLSASISLDTSALPTTTAGIDVTLPKDSYRQSWRVEGTYTSSPRLNNTLTLETSRWQDLNISGINSSSNQETRNYRTEWRWTCRILPSLTATQRNSISADYVRQLFNTTQNRLTMDFASVTTLNAIVSRKLQLDLTHNARYQPSGSYLLHTDGLDYFSPASEGRNYIISSNIRYTASPALTLSLSPSFQYLSRGARVGPASTLQNTDRRLSVSGRSDVNVPVGSKGRLTGGISRVFNAQRSTDYPSGRPLPKQLLETDYWEGTLQLSWKL